MYKLLIFLHKPIDEKNLNHFKDYTLKLFSEITDQEIKLAQVESNLLVEQKYSYFCEIIFQSKDQMDIMMNSKAGVELNKNLMDFHQHLTIINVNYNQ